MATAQKDVDYDVIQIGYGPVKQSLGAVFGADGVDGWSV